MGVVLLSAMVCLLSAPSVFFSENGAASAGGRVAGVACAIASVGFDCPAVNGAFSRSPVSGGMVIVSLVGVTGMTGLSRFARSFADVAASVSSAPGNVPVVFSCDGSAWTQAVARGLARLTACSGGCLVGAWEGDGNIGSEVAAPAELIPAASCGGAASGTARKTAG